MAGPHDHARGDGGDRARARRLRRLVAGWVAAAIVAGGGVIGANLATLAVVPDPWLLASLWLVTVLAGVVVIELDYGGMGESISPTEVAAVLLMVLLPLPWGVLVALTSLPVANAFTTRLAAPKMAFNIAWSITGIALGSAAFSALAGPTFTAGARDILAAALAALILVVVNTVALAGVVATMSDQPLVATLRSYLPTRLPLFFGMGMTGVLAAVLAVEAPIALPLLAVPTLTDYVRARARRLDLQLEIARRQAEAASAAKSEFLAHMSHELRTPLTSILGFGQLLELQDLGPDQQQAVRHILRAGRHLQSLIDDVLDLSRVEAGAMDLTLEAVAIDVAVSDAVAMIRPLAEARQITVSSDAVSCDVWVLVDRRRCHQVLLNLLSNAVKYNREGGDVAVRCELRDPTTARVSVRDTGPGIDLGRHDQLFQPFERLGADATGVSGSGLGLALSKQLVDAMGGAIGLDRTPGRGSTFWIDLPVTSGSADPQPAVGE